MKIIYSKFYATLVKGKVKVIRVLKECKTVIIEVF